MNTNRTFKVTVIVILILIVGGLVGYLWGQSNKNNEINAAKEAATKQANENAKQAATNARTKPDADKTPAEKAPAKTVPETTCNADELAIAVEADDVSAGTMSYAIVLTNSGKRSCTLYGFPGVSLVDSNGNQVGSPAERATNYVEERIVLAPGAKVKSIASISNSTNFTDGQCKTGATKLRVYPPNDTGYISVDTDITAWCPGFVVSPMLKV